MQHSYFNFILTSDAKRRIPKMILERLANEYLWQQQEYVNGQHSVKERTKRIRGLIEDEVVRRNAQKEFNAILAKIVLK